MSSLHRCAGRLFRTCPGSSRAPVAKCVVCAWNGTRSVSGRAEPASRTFRDQVYVVSQVRRRCLATQRREDKACQFEVDTSLDREPVQLTQNWRDMFPSSSCSEKMSGSILCRLNFPNNTDTPLSSELQ